jgi:hypothetical protein
LFFTNLKSKKWNFRSILLCNYCKNNKCTPIICKFQNVDIMIPSHELLLQNSTCTVIICKFQNVDIMIPSHELLLQNTCTPIICKLQNVDIMRITWSKNATSWGNYFPYCCKNIGNLRDNCGKLLYLGFIIFFGFCYLVSNR